MLWDDLDMELERKRRDFERRLEEGRREIQGRLDRVERCCREAEGARRRDCEELKGRMMTAEEERRHQSDGVLRLMTAMTSECLAIAQAVARNCGVDSPKAGRKAMPPAKC